ncbi:MAG: hypothetical protein R3312_10535 [Gammaproteobacteria bacterium]|nr:hypothetical protein [Gammaproteobacteria bacterium]
MQNQLNRVLLKFTDALHGELGIHAQIRLMIEEPIYRDEVLNRAELMGGESLRKLAETIRHLTASHANTDITQGLETRKIS